MIMRRRGNSFDRGKYIHVVIVRPDNMKDTTKCVGVFSNMKDAKKVVIAKAFSTVTHDHYNPLARFTPFKEFAYSLSRSTEIGYKDTWAIESGVARYYIETWVVDSHDYKPICITECTLDYWIKSQVYNGRLFGHKVKDIIAKWRESANFGLFYDSCFITPDMMTVDTKPVWVDVPKVTWDAMFEDAELHDRMMVRKSQSVMVRR